MLCSELENLRSVPGEVHVVDDEERPGALSRRGLKGAREIARMRHRQFEKADSERYADRFAWTEVLHRGWEGYVAKDPESPYVTTHDEVVEGEATKVS